MEMQMNDIILAQSNTMTSTQLAELLGYEKKEINKKVRAMFGDDTAREKFYPVLDSQNRVNYYNLPELESKMFVAKHDIQYLETITQYWIDKSKPQLPDFNNAVLMARTWADDQEEKQRLKIESELAHNEVDRLQGVCNTITAQFTPGVTATEFCKQLNGVNTQQVNSAIAGMGMLLRRSNCYVPSSYSRDRYFIERQETHNGSLRYHSEVTLKGCKWLYKAYLGGKLPMKKTWDGKLVHVVFTGE